MAANEEAGAQEVEDKGEDGEETMLEGAVSGVMAVGSVAAMAVETGSMAAMAVEMAVEMDLEVAMLLTEVMVEAVGTGEEEATKIVTIGTCSFPLLSYIS